MGNEVAHSGTIIDTEGKHLQPLPVQHDSMIERLARDPTIDVAKIRELMELRDRDRATVARQAFNLAFANFKAEAVRIIKGTEIKDGPLKGKMHANLFDVVKAATVPLAKYGLSTAWSLTKDEPGWMEVTCILRHADGHSESVSMGAAPDTGPGRNAIQARGSAKTYLERYTLTAILGLAAADSDDDGAGGPKNDLAPMTADHADTIDSKCKEVGPKMLGTVLKSYKAAKLEEIPDLEYATIISRLDATLKKKVAP